MHRNPMLWCAIVAFGVAAWLLVPQMVTPRRPRAKTEDSRMMDYICRETKEVFRLSASAPVLVNPKTGKTTLVPAMFDARRKVWMPGPSAEVRQLMKRRRG